MTSELTLRVISDNRTALTNQGVFLVRANGALIGRSETCDVVLVDPDKVISSQHAEIRLESSKFVITDHSTNGLFINNESSPVGRGVSRDLCSGTQIAIGDYIMIVEIEAATAPDIPLSSDLNGDPELLNAGFDPLASGAPPPADASQASALLDIPQGIEIETSESLTLNDDWGEQPSAGSSPDEADWSMGSTGVDHGNSVSDPFVAPESTLDANLPKSPGSEETGSTGIPEDWMLDEASATSGEASASAPDISSAQPEQSAEPSPSETDVEAIETDREWISDASSAESPYSAENAQNPAIDDQRAAASETFTALEELLLQGLMDLLAARAELKNEFRMDRTIIRTVENNPLKFAPNIEVAKSLLSSGEGSAYLSTDQAVNESFSDIKHHQLALMIGMREALQKLAERINPQNFEQSSNGSGLGKLVGSDDKRAWQAYKEFYRTRVVEADDLFDELFGRALSDAYQAAVNKKNAGET